MSSLSPTGSKASLQLLLRIGAVVAMLPLSGAAELSSKEISPPPVIHTIQAEHPGMDESADREQRLIQRHNRKTGKVEFYLDTESVFCADGECAIVLVRLFWDNLGFYKRFKLASGVELEKAEGKPFSDEDYQKLQRILLDRDSLLKDISLDDINHHEATTSEVDAVTSATPVIYEDAAVQGAAWTSFTLWHWANGEVSRIILDMVTQTATLEDLAGFLKSPNPDHKSFALHQLMLRKAYDPTSVAAVVRHVRGQSRDITKLALKYLEQGSAEVFYTSIKRMFRKAIGNQRSLILDQLLTSKHTPPAGFLDDFSKQLATTEAYQEVDLMLRLMESRNTNSPKMIAQTMLLLESSDFLIARRAYWFLNEQTVTPEQQGQLDAFEQRYAERL